MTTLPPAPVPANPQDWKRTQGVRVRLDLTPAEATVVLDAVRLLQRSVRRRGGSTERIARIGDRLRGAIADCVSTLRV